MHDVCVDVGYMHGQVPGQMCAWVDVGMDPWMLG